MIGQPEGFEFHQRDRKTVAKNRWVIIKQGKEKMKKIVGLLLCMVLLFSLCGCNSQNYKKATALYRDGDYLSAKAIFDELGDYEDAAEMSKDCSYNMAVALLNDGAYSDAYKIFFELADYKDSDVKEVDVVAENIIAVLSEEASDLLKDPSSFVLREGFYYGHIASSGGLFEAAVLYLSGNNSYGAAVSSYWLYAYNDAEECWEFLCDYDTTYIDSEDSAGDAFRKSIAKQVMGDGIELRKDQIKRINTMFKEDVLDEVVLIDHDIIDFSVFPFPDYSEK